MTELSRSNSSVEIKRFDRFLRCWNYNTQLHLWRYVFAAGYVQDKTVLDVACGVGYGADWVGRKIGSGQLVGVDLSERSLKFARDAYMRPNLNFVLGNGLLLPIKRNSVDVVISFETIEHVPMNEQKAFVAEVYRVLKPGGTFLCSTPNKEFSPGHVDHTREFTPAEFFEMLESHFRKVEKYGQYITLKDLEFQRSQTGTLGFQAKRKRAILVRKLSNWFNQTPSHIRFKNLLKQVLRRNKQSRLPEPVYISDTLVNTLDDTYAPVPINGDGVLFGLLAIAHKD